MTRVPQIIVTLNPHGKLKIELPGVQSTRRSVEIIPGHAEETILRILRAQLEDRTEIGLDGAPTQAQVRHWERHEIWPDGQCRFCQAEGRVKRDDGQGLRKGKKILFDRGDVQARKIPAKTKGVAKPQVAKANAEELGL